ncbi:MAG: hypothetical protein LAT64_13320 [Phycisphaerales bacterium]|nr:hypothetical protein [Planctomycetota bacterium]MCH8509735.1 hypothetical protein [Phycisphaerales bacterium]
MPNHEQYTLSIVASSFSWIAALGIPVVLFLGRITFLMWASRLSDDEKSLLATVYATDYQTIAMERAMGIMDHLVINKVSIYPWKESDGTEPALHKDERTHWISVFERLCERGYFTRTGRDIYRMTGRGAEAAKSAGLPRNFEAEREQLLSGILTG